MNPKISVVIPVYNGEKFLAKAVRSALEQDYPAHEVVVVDDGSTDGTAAVMRSFGDRIVAKTIPNSGGPSRPRNTAIALCSGDYVAFLDADDFWFRNKLSSIVDYIRRFPQVGLLCSDFIMRNEGSHRRLVRHTSLIRQAREIRFNEPMGGKALPLLLGENFVGTPSSVIVKREVFAVSGDFIEDYRMAEDLEFYLRVALGYDFLVIDEVLAFKHDHVDNLSFDKVQLYTGHKRILTDFCERYKEEMKRRGLYDKYRDAAALMEYMTGNAYFETGRRREAFAAYLRGLRTSSSPVSVGVFAWTALKKSVRVMTADKINRKVLRY